MFSKSALYKEDIEFVKNFDIDWDKLRNTTILVTGATGLIGTVIVDVLMSKNETEGANISVIATSRSIDKLRKHFSAYEKEPIFSAIQCDVTQEIALSQKVDFIISLASNTHPVLYATEPINTIETIVAGTKNILQFAVTCGAKRVINASSVEIYGENRGDVDRFTEDYCGYINCNTLRAGYTEGKRLAESLCQAYVEEKNLDVISVRLGRVYGSTLLATDTKSTTQFIRKSVNREDIILKSEGKQEFSFVYVADAVSAIFLLLTRGKRGEAYNVAHDEVKSLRGVAEILAKLNGKEVLFDLPTNVETKGFSVVQKALMDCEKIAKIGWKANYDLEAGLNRTVAIIRSENA